MRKHAREDREQKAHDDGERADRGEELRAELGVEPPLAEIPPDRRQESIPRSLYTEALYW